jgi:hypothetical protein
MGGCGASIRRVLATQSLILRTHSEILGVVLLRHETPPIHVRRTPFYSRSTNRP